MQQSDRAGLLFALLGFVIFSFTDATMKSMGGEWPPTAVGAVRYLLAAITFSGILVVTEGKEKLWRIPVFRLQLLRGVSIAVVTLCMFVSVWLMPLAQATAITFMQPMLTALLATLFLGERLRRAALLATVVGFSGVIIVLRPNLAAIGWVALLPLVVATGMACLMTGNRASVGAASPLASQAYLCNIAAIVLVLASIAGDISGIAELQIGWPSWSVLARCAFVAAGASSAHFLIYLGATRAGAATIAPMAYFQLLMSVVLGWAIFGERPDAITLLGAGVIVSAGLFLWQFGRRRDLARPAN